MWSGQGDVFRLTFSAHIPQGVPSRSAPLLNQTELLNRLKALADENRIKILHLLRDSGELSTQDIMERLVKGGGNSVIYVPDFSCVWPLNNARGQSTFNRIQDT